MLTLYFINIKFKELKDTLTDYEDSRWFRFSGHLVFIDDVRATSIANVTIFIRMHY